MNKLVCLVMIGFSVSLVSCKKELNLFKGKKSERLEYQDFDFDYLKSRAKFKYTSPKQNISATANFRIQHDSVIWVSVSPGLGIELARVNITRDKIEALDKLKKDYYSYSYKELSQKYGVTLNYDLIESIAVGNVLFPPRSRKAVSKEGERFRFSYEEGPFGVIQFVGQKSRKLEQLEAYDQSTNNTISVNYGEFQQIEKQIIPGAITASVHFANQRRTGPTKIEIEYKKTEIQTEPLRFPFHVSSKYTRK